VWGVFGVVLPVLVLPAVLGIAFGAAGLSRARDRARRGLPADGRGLSIAGIVLGSVAIVLGVAIFGLLFWRR
ncbi:MAG: hypothetical protein QM598_00665, partial [Protaetiibacter sp.]